MPYVWNKISWGSDHLYYILEPLLPEDIKIRGGGKYKQSEMERIFKDIRKESKNKRKRARTEMYHVYHASFKRGIKKFKGKSNRLMTGLSVDFTEPDSRFGLKPSSPTGMDWTAHFARFYEELLKGVNSVVKEHKKKYGEDLTGYEDEVIHPVSPIFFPFVFNEKDGDIIMEHAAPEAVLEAELYLEQKNKHTFGSLDRLVKQEGPMTGNYEFSVKLFSGRVAKKARTGYVDDKEFSMGFIKRNIPFLSDYSRDKVKKCFEIGYEKTKGVVQEIFKQEYENVIDRSTYLNKQLMALAIKESLLNPLDIKEIDVIAMESSYVWDILKFIDGVEFISWKVMENAERSSYREADPSSINRIMGGFYSDWKRRMRA